MCLMNVTQANGSWDCRVYNNEATTYDEVLENRDFGATGKTIGNNIVMNNALGVMNDPGRGFRYGISSGNRAAGSTNAFAKNVVKYNTFEDALSDVYVRAIGSYYDTLLQAQTDYSAHFNNNTGGVKKSATAGGNLDDDHVRHPPAR